MKLTIITVKRGCDEIIVHIEAAEGEIESIVSTELNIRDYELVKNAIKCVSGKGVTIVCATNHLLCVKKIEELIERWIWRDAAVVNASGKVILSLFIGREFSVNYSRLARIFKEEHKMSVETFYILRQTLAAEKLLYENKLSLLQISEALNFCSEQAFSKYFMKHNGSSPSIYRNSIKN